MGAGKLFIALVQMNCKLGDKQENMRKALKRLEEVGGKVDIVCFPEFFTTGYNLDLIGDKFYHLAEPIPGETTDKIGKIARDYNLIVIGAIPERDVVEGVLYNTAFIIDEDGEVIGKYRKTHLYPSEHKYFRAGNKLPVFNTRICKLGVAICYDHAFPEVFRILALKGAQIVFIPISEPRGFEHLQNLRTRARAQDNQIFVASVNHVGAEGDVMYCGESIIAGPRGEIIAQASSNKEEILIAEVDLDQILRERKREPTLRSRRPEIYGDLCKL